MKKVEKDLKDIVGDDWIITNPELVESYLEDESPKGAKINPVSGNIVVKPADSQQLSKILKIANRENVPIFVRGGATGLVGGCVPTKKGVIISMERLKDIEIDSKNLTATAKAGVTLEELFEEVEKENLSFPPHPGDEAAQIGGLVACNAGGVRAVKTGVMRNFVMGLEVVLPTGEITHIGGKLIKDNISASKLMHFFVGTEGIFGVITEATLKLLPSKEATATMIVPFENKHNAMNIVPEILKSELTPQGLEYVEKRSIELGAKELGYEWPCEEGDASLILIFTEPNEEALYSGLETLSTLLEDAEALEPLLADSTRQQEKILEIRSELYPTLKPDLHEDLDVCVPINKLSELLEKLDEISNKYNTYLHPYGHAGDGNIHIHVMENEEWGEEKYEKITEEIYKTGVELEGVITGEHGVGEAKRKFAHLNLDENSRKALEKIKKALDPKNILNPGKIIELE